MAKLAPGEYYAVVHSNPPLNVIVTTRTKRERARTFLWVHVVNGENRGRQFWADARMVKGKSDQPPSKSARRRKRRALARRAEVQQIRKTGVRQPAVSVSTGQSRPAEVTYAERVASGDVIRMGELDS